MSKSKYAKRIPLPHPDSVNGGLHSPLNRSVIAILGQPTGQKTKSLIVTMDVGPFRATGLKPFLELLKKIFAKVKAEKPQLYEDLKTAGCLNIRPQRGSNSIISNHSWGIAIDLYFGDAVTPRGSGQTEQGLLELYPYFHNEGLYWGVEYRVDDGMHVEASLELLLKWDKANVI